MIRRHAEIIGGSAEAMGAALLELRDEKLYLEVSDSFTAYLRDVVEVPLSTAYRRMNRALETASLPPLSDSGKGRPVDKKPREGISRSGNTLDPSGVIEASSRRKPTTRLLGAEPDGPPLELSEPASAERDWDAEFHGLPRPELRRIEAALKRAWDRTAPVAIGPPASVRQVAPRFKTSTTKKAD